MCAAVALLVWGMGFEPPAHLAVVIILVAIAQLTRPSIMPEPPTPNPAPPPTPLPSRTDYPATAHGALLSGQKAARDLLRGLPGFAAAAGGAALCDLVEGLPAGSNATDCGGSGLRGRRRRLRFALWR